MSEADPILSPIDGDLAQRREDAKETTDVAPWRLCAFARHLSLAEGAIRIASASFDEYWAFHLRSEQQRIHLSRYANGALERAA